MDEGYLYRQHSREEIHGWARALRYFRFVRAYGGHNNDGDQLLVALTDLDHESGAGVYVHERSGLVMLSMSDGYDVTDAVVRAALTVEGTLDASRVVDPPQDDDHCVCPKFYPRIWD